MPSGFGEFGIARREHRAGHALIAFVLQSLNKSGNCNAEYSRIKNGCADAITSSSRSRKARFKTSTTRSPPISESLMAAAMRSTPCHSQILKPRINLLLYIAPVAPIWLNILKCSHSHPHIRPLFNISTSAGTTRASFNVTSAHAADQRTKTELSFNQRTQYGITKRFITERIASG